MTTQFARFHPIRLLAILIVLATLPAQSSFGQAFWPAEETKTNVNNYYYYYVNPGTPTIRVHVLGAVRLPGLYEISSDTDLGEIIALSGGPPIAPHASNSRTDVTIQIYRSTTGERSKVYDEQFTHSLTGFEGHPQLMDGDVVMMDVTHRQLFSWRDVTRVISSVAVVILAAERLSRVSLR